MKQIRVHRYGGPEVLTLEELPTPKPSPGEVLVKVEATGINFVETYQRTGQVGYRFPLPYAPGSEGAGVVLEVGAGVSAFKPGDRVAWGNGVSGSYATHAIAAAERLVPIPPGVSARDAAAAMLQGMTAHYLTHTTYPLQPDETCLVHAAAGGVGALLCQLAHAKGARVIGTVGSREKVAIAKEAGADEVILYREQDFQVEVMRLTGGRGVNVIYDGVGKDTFEQGLRSLARRGFLVVYGQASGAVLPFDIQALADGGSTFVTRPKLLDHVVGSELQTRAAEVLRWVADGALRLHIAKTYRLEQVAQAHIDLAGRSLSGKLLLIPDAG